MTRKRALTAQIKPETRNAIMDQLALAANTIIQQRECIAEWQAWQNVRLPPVKPRPEFVWWSALVALWNGWRK